MSRALPVWILALFFGVAFPASDENAASPVAPDASASFAEERAVSAAIAHGYLRAFGDGRGGVRPGALFVIGDIAIRGRQNFQPAEMGLSAFVGQAATAANLEALSGQARSYLLDHGYPFAELRLDFSARDTEPVVDLRVAIRSGKGFKYGGIKYSGSKIRPEPLERLSLLRYGEDYNESRLRQAEARLARTGYFEVLAPGTLFRDSVKNILYPTLALTDLKGNRFGGLFGYDSRHTGPQGWNGYLDIHLINLRGTARDLDFTFDSKASGPAGTPEREAKAVYTEPWILGSPVGGRVNLQISQQDSVYDENNRELTLFQDIDFHSRYEVSFAWQSNRDYLANRGSSASIAGIGLVYDARDRVPGTLQGAKFSTRVNGLRRDLGDSSYYLAQSIDQADLWAHRGRWVGYAQLAGGGNWPLRKDGNRGEWFSLGGANTIRGFREKEFLTDLYAYANLELQFLLAPRSRAVVFVVPAWINRLEGKVHGREVTGYGAGMELGSKDWSFGISYALNPERRWGDGFVHLRAVNNF